MPAHRDDEREDHKAVTDLAEHARNLAEYSSRSKREVAWALGNFLFLSRFEFILPRSSQIRPLG